MTFPASEDPNCTTPGCLSTLLYNARVASAATTGFRPGAAGKALCYTDALAIHEWVSSGDVLVVAGGLQTTTTAANPTGPPAAPVALKMT